MEASSGGKWSSREESVVNRRRRNPGAAASWRDAFQGSPLGSRAGILLCSGAEGQLETRTLVRLDQCEPGTRARIGRILDQAPAFLKFVEKRKLQPGEEVELVERDLIGKTLVLARAGGGQVVLSLSVAEKILLEEKGEIVKTEDERKES
jgi:hypothetical protein